MYTIQLLDRSKTWDIGVFSCFSLQPIILLGLLWDQQSHLLCSLSSSPSSSVLSSAAALHKLPTANAQLLQLLHNQPLPLPPSSQQALNSKVASRPTQQLLRERTLPHHTLTHHRRWLPNLMQRTLLLNTHPRLHTQLTHLSKLREGQPKGMLHALDVELSLELWFLFVVVHNIYFLLGTPDCLWVYFCFMHCFIWHAYNIFIASVATVKLIAQVDLVLICAICIGISTIAVDEGSSILSWKIVWSCFLSIVHSSKCNVTVMILKCFLAVENMHLGGCNRQGEKSGCF